jgi:hypothetical protein
MPTDQRPRGFVAAFFATLILIELVLIGTNVIVDPFWRFDLVSIRGFNAQKSVFGGFGRMAKAGVLCRMQPTQIALGTSRAEVGIDPSYPAWNSVAGPVYNFALAGLGLKELTLMFADAVNASPNLKRATIGLDFLMFNANREAVVFGTEVFDFDPARFLQSPSDSCLRSLWYDADRYLGGRGLYYSYRTVLEQRSDRDDTSEFAKVMYWMVSITNSDFAISLTLSTSTFPSVARARYSVMARNGLTLTVFGERDRISVIASPVPASLTPCRSFAILWMTSIAPGSMCDFTWIRCTRA